MPQITYTEHTGASRAVEATVGDNGGRLVPFGGVLFRHGWMLLSWIPIAARAAAASALRFVCHALQQR